MQGKIELKREAECAKAYPDRLTSHSANNGRVLYVEIQIRRSFDISDTVNVTDAQLQYLLSSLCLPQLICVNFDTSQGRQKCGNIFQNATSCQAKLFLKIF